MIFSCPNCATRYQIGDASFPLAGRTVRCAKCSHSWHQQGPSTAAPKPAAPAVMVIACPECASRFQVDKTKFPAAGRNVRCAKCQHTWHQSAPAAGVAAQASLAIPPYAESVIAASPSQSPATPQAHPQAAPSIRDAISPTMEMLRNHAATSTRQAWEGRRSTKANALYATAFVGLLSVGTWLIVHHHAGAVRAPAAATSPNTAAPSPNVAAAKSGILLRNVTTEREITDTLGIIFIVNGTIVNNTKHELPLPKTIEVQLTDAGNHQLFHAAFPPSVKKLGSGESVPFRTRIYDAPKDTVHLQVSLGKS